MPRNADLEFRLDLHHRLAAHFLRREAEALIEPGE
jgi:hypothetical protein